MKVAKYFKSAFGIAMIAMSILSTGATAFAASPIDIKRSDLSNLGGRINALRSLAETKAKDAYSLRAQLESFDVELQETELRIQKLIGEIELIDMEIAEVSGEISRAEAEKLSLQDTLRKAIRLKYSQGDVDAMEILASSNSLSDLLNAESYTQALQDKINDIVKRVKELEAQLRFKKAELEVKKQEQLNLRNEQEVIKNEVGNQIAAKNHLLAVTQGDQNNYNKLIASSLKEQAEVNGQIARMMASSTPAPAPRSTPAPAPRSTPAPRSNPAPAPTPTPAPRYVTSGRVNTGDVIGYQDNTGFSTGSHLHFGLYRNGKDIDPMPFLGGYLAWPLNGRIMQTYWGNFSHAGAGWPGGLDIAAYPGAPVRAARSGTIVFNGGNPRSGFGHYVIINHGDGYTTLYAHMQ